MARKVDPLSIQVPIVDPRNGTPTPEFMRKWLRQHDVNLTAEAWRAIEIIAGTGLTGGGALGAGNVTLNANIQTLLNLISTTRGAILYRGATTWGALAPDTDGKVLTTHGAGADPTWETPAGGGGGDWTLAASRDFSASPIGTATFWDVTGLAGANDILIVVRAVTMVASGTVFIQVSTDNGSNFLTSSGDYVELAATGAETARTRLIPYNSAATAARSGWTLIRGCNVASPKSVDTIFAGHIVPTTSAINAVRLLVGGTGPTNGGNGYVLWR